MGTLLEIQHLYLAYHTRSGETPALEDINLCVDSGEFVSLVGPSGCGKSTLLSAIAHLQEPSSGNILIHSELLENKTAHVGYMFQHDQLLEWRTVLSNACLGLEIQKKLTKENLTYVHHLLEAYGLDQFQNHYPSQLSGGMRQRAALIRTMALKPEILLLDEPFSALDYQTRLQVSDEIYSILKKAGKTAILVTHDISEAISLGDRVVVLSKRPGHVLRDIPIDFGSERMPLKVRKHPNFQQYFQEIWEVMTREE